MIALIGLDWVCALGWFGREGLPAGYKGAVCVGTQSGLGVVDVDPYVFPSGKYLPLNTYQLAILHSRTPDSVFTPPSAQLPACQHLFASAPCSDPRPGR